MTAATTSMCLLPPAFQAIAMAIDEGWFHRRRGLPKWERVGHPLDTVTVAGCYLWLVVHDPSDPSALAGYAALAVFSCLFVTKDEFVHARLCSPGEMWLHAVLFVLHPMVLGAFALIWWSGAHPILLRLQVALTLSFALYQLIYWSVPWKQMLTIRDRSTTTSTRRSDPAGTTRTTTP